MLDPVIYNTKVLEWIHNVDYQNLDWYKTSTATWIIIKSVCLWKLCGIKIFWLANFSRYQKELWEEAQEERDKMLIKFEKLSEKSDR